jgi:hypothetical protein
MRVPAHQRKSYAWRWTAALAGLAVLAVVLVTWQAGVGTPATQAQATDTVDIIDGSIDVDQSGSVTTADDLTDVLLIVDEAGANATLKVVDIRDGKVDVNESGSITTDGADDVANATLFQVSALAGVLVDIEDGGVDVDGGGVGATDDLTGVRLVADAAVTDKVDVIAGNVDVNESGSITTADDRANVLLFEDGGSISALFVASVVDGGVDVNASGDITATDDLDDVTLFVSGAPGAGNQVDIVDGQVDVDEDTDIDAADALTDALLVADFGGMDQVDILAGGEVDVNESGDATSTDDLADVLLEVSDDGDRTLILVDVIDGGVDVNGDGNITPADDVDEATVFKDGGIDAQSDIADGFFGGAVANAILVASGAVGPGATATPTRTPTPSITNTPTITPTATGTPPTSTPTKTVTPGGPTATPTTGAMESVTLVGGTCNPVASTYPDGTPITTIANAVSPSGILISIWWFNPGTASWLGYSPQFPQASDLTAVDRLEAIFICVSSAGSWSRPII